MSHPFFSIIIPTLNEEDHINSLLKSISKQTYKEYEVLIRDCVSTDNTINVIKSYEKDIPQINLISSKTKNVSEARNSGAKSALGEWLIFFDADVEIESNFLMDVKKHIEEDRPHFLTMWNRPQKQDGFQGRFLLYGLSIGMSILQYIMPAVNGPCMIIKKDLFKSLNGFDEEIVFGEDFDLTRRANKQKAIVKIYTKPNIFVSGRRFDTEGIPLSIYKSIKAFWYQLTVGPIRTPIFTYKMGGQEFKKKI